MNVSISFACEPPPDFVSGGLIRWYIGLSSPTYPYSNIGPSMMYFYQGYDKNGMSQQKTVMGFSNERVVFVGKTSGYTGEFDLDVAGRIHSDKQLELSESSGTNPFNTDTAALYVKANGVGNGVWLRYRTTAGAWADVKLGGA